MCYGLTGAEIWIVGLICLNLSIWETWSFKRIKLY